MSNQPPRILVLGYGNPGRCDNGLGPALAARLETLHPPGVTAGSDCQLCVKHAEQVSHYGTIQTGRRAAVNAQEPS